MIRVEDILPDYSSPIKNYAQLCLICAVVGLGSGFIHHYVSVTISIFGYSLIILSKYRYDKRTGADPFSISFKKMKLNDNYNKQETQLVVMGGVLMFCSFFSGGFAPYMGRAVERAIITPLFG